MAKESNSLDGITFGGSGLVELIKNQRDPDVAEIVREYKRAQKMQMGRRLCLRKRKEKPEKPSKVRHIVMDGEKLSHLHQTATVFINNPNTWFSNKDVVKLTGCSLATTFARMSQFIKIGLTEKRIGASDRNKRETQYKLKEVLEIEEITKKINANRNKNSCVKKVCSDDAAIKSTATKVNSLDALMLMMRDAVESFPQLELTITIRSK